MELEAAKMIGAGLAAIALAGAGVGIGIIFGNYLSGAMRNPSAAQKQFPNLLLGFALAEATGLFGLVVRLPLSGETMNPRIPPRLWRGSWTMPCSPRSESPIVDGLHGL